MNDRIGGTYGSPITPKSGIEDATPRRFRYFVAAEPIYTVGVHIESEFSQLEGFSHVVTMESEGTPAKAWVTYFSEVEDALSFAERRVAVDHIAGLKASYVAPTYA